MQTESRNQRVRDRGKSEGQDQRVSCGKERSQGGIHEGMEAYVEVYVLGYDEGTYRGKNEKNRAEALLAMGALGRILESILGELVAVVREGRILSSIIYRYVDLKESPFMRWLLQFGSPRECNNDVNIKDSHAPNAFAFQPQASNIGCRTKGIDSISDHNPVRTREACPSSKMPDYVLNGCSYRNGGYVQCASEARQSDKTSHVFLPTIQDLKLDMQDERIGAIMHLVE
eukprot:Gb_23598 [translate_table: standard]